MPNAVEAALKQACRITGATWAALVGGQGGNPLVLAACKLSAARGRALENCLSTGQGRAWYGAAGRPRRTPFGVPRGTVLGATKLWGFSAGQGTAVVVAAESRSRADPEIWSLVASLVGTAGADVSGASADGLLPPSAYGTQQGLDGVLAGFLDGDDLQGGWIGVRRGEQLIILADRESPLRNGAVLDLQTSGLLQKVRRERKPMLARKGTAAWATVPHPPGGSADFWAAFPLVVENRFIGAVAVWGQGRLRARRFSDLAGLAHRASQPVDLVVSLGELSSQLRRLATLNEFALTLSSAEELPRTVERAMAHLGAIFPSHAISLYVPATDENRMQEFRYESGRFRTSSAELRGHPMSQMLVTDTEAPALTGESPSPEAVRRWPVPLRYRETTVGMLVLDGGGGSALSRYDESILAVVASYMAGVVERSRLRHESTTRRRQLEQTIRQLQEAEATATTRLAAQQAAESRLLQAAKLVAVGEMAAGVAHELNNPLTTVTGFTELLLEDAPADAPYRSDLEMVLHEARRARSVVRRLLDFARQGEQVRARADINEIVDDVLALMTHFIHTSGVQLEVELDHGLPWITLDANQIKQVLLNLLHNALHAMPGGGRLQVGTELKQRDGRTWIVTRIADTGIGIEATDLERIFEPFYTTRAGAGGTGLGLSVTYGIVSDHSGTIEVQSQRGVGSTFSVWLPV